MRYVTIAMVATTILPYSPPGAAFAAHACKAELLRRIFTSIMRSGPCGGTLIAWLMSETKAPLPERISEKTASKFKEVMAKP